MTGKISTFKGDMFPVTLHLATGFKDAADLNTTLHRKNILGNEFTLNKPKADAATTYFLEAHPHAIIVIWDEHSLASLVHEAVHAGTYFCKVLGISTSHDEDEPLAYITGWVFRVCEKAMR